MVEIERKFLVRSDQWRSEVTTSLRIRQAYLPSGDRLSVRVRITDQNAVMTLKGPGSGITRAECEFAMPLDDAIELLDNWREGNVIDKTRHLVKHGDHTWEIDCFHGAFEGLVVAEIELGHEDEAFLRPPWVDIEVSHDRSYSNRAMATVDLARAGPRKT